MLDATTVHHYLDTHLDTPQVNKVQHGFPSPRFWTEPHVPTDQIAADRRALRAARRDTPVNLYVGVPYCIATDPGKCGYCLFPVEQFTGNTALEHYFGSLRREATLYRDALAGATLGGVYFGGGTANLYRPPIYAKLMDLVQELFPTIDPQVDITLEGIPQLFTRATIEAIADAGMNRISMGVQQINERLNKLSGRKQTLAHTIHSLAWAAEFGLAANVDLIFGWPQQTIDTMVEDLDTVISWGVHDITHYQLNVGGPTDFALNRFHELPSPLSALQMYRASRDLLLSRGYQQITAYNFRKPGDPLSRGYAEGVTPRVDTLDSVGLGYAANTFFGDATLPDGHAWSYSNHATIGRYQSMVAEGVLPIGHGFRHTAQDWRLAMLFRTLLGLSVDRAAYHTAYGLDVYAEHRTIWDALGERGLVEVTAEKITLVGDGPFYTPMIQSLLAQQRYQSLRERVSATTTARASTAHPVTSAAARPLASTHQGTP